MSIEKSTALLGILSKALNHYSTQCLDPKLGDRRSYVGLSDVGRGIECLRAAVASKLYPRAQQAGTDYESILRLLRQQIVLQRGHWQEDGIGAALTAFGLRSIPQLSIALSYKNVPIQAHLDFTLVWGGSKPTVRVLELKSNENIPKTLYASYETQLHGQLALLRKAWNKRCFWDTDRNVYVTFPDLVSRLFDVSMPDNPNEVDIEGWIVSLAMSDIKVFGAYEPNTFMLGKCLDIATRIWNCVQAIREGTMTLDDVEYHKGFHPLCDWCKFNADCPKYRSEEAWSVPEAAQELERLAALKAEAKALKARIKEMETRVIQTYAALNPNGAWITAGDCRFRASLQPGKETIDRDALTNELLYLLEGDEERVASVLRNVTRTGECYERLWVSPIHRIIKSIDKAA